MAGSDTIVAVDDTAATSATAAIWIGAANNDTDSTGAPLSILSVDVTGGMGTVTLNPSAPNGFVYSPNGAFDYLSAGETATETLVYTVSDGLGDTSTATVTVTITGVNFAPVATNETATTGAYTNIAVNALAGVTDVNRDDVETITALNLTGTKGTATIDPATGQIDYSPNGAFDYLSAGQSATDTLKYTVSDGHGGSSTATLTITVTGVNVPPVAKPDSATVGAYSSVWVGAANADTDINLADHLSVVSLNLTGTKGTATLNPSATNGFTYVPNGAFDYLSAGETATDTLQYTISDGHGGTSTATVTITVTGVNVAPVATNETATTGAYTNIAINALAGVTDVNRDDVETITALNLTGTKGSATIDPATGQIDYSPNGAFDYLRAGQSATDTFKYTVSDGHGGSSTATVTVTITGVNEPPVANPDTATVGAYSAIWVGAANNDTEINAGDTLSVIALNLTGTKGTATLNPSAPNGFEYSPNGAFDYLSAGETATDTLQYTLSNGNGGTSVGTVTITVTGVNVPPVANPDFATVGAYSSVWVGAANNDTEANAGDTLSVIALNLTGTKGTATLNPSATNGFEYSPNGAFDYLSAGETATDTLQYTVSNGNGGTSVGTVTITVTGVNEPPVATNETATTGAYTNIAINALAGVTDVNRDDVETITALNLTGIKGTATIDPATGQIDYSPNGAFDYLSAGQSATDTLQYTVSDGHGGSSTATLTVTVTGVNVPPVANPDTVTVGAYSSVWVGAANNDTEANAGDTLSVIALNLTGTKGTATLNPSAPNGFEYSPNGAFDYLRAGQTATDTLQYTVSNGNGGTSVGTVTITVTGVNVPPVANPDFATVGAYSAVWVGAANNDTEANAGDTLSVIALNLAGTKGTATLNPSATNGFVYSPNGAFDYLSAGETATDTLQYTVSNGNGGTSVGTVTITVTGVNEPPVATNETATTGAYTNIAINALAGVTDVNRDDVETITALNLTGTKGTATIDPATGQIDYSPNGAFDYLSAGQSATDTLKYTVSDGHGGTSTATLTVTVTGVNVPPVAKPDSATVGAYSSVWVGAANADTDVNLADHLSVVSLNLSGTKGTATLNPSATNGFTYAPNGAFDYLSAGETATDTLQYTISDGHGGTSTATVTITVTGVNVAPVATNETATTGAYTNIAINALAGVTDVNRDDVETITALNLTGTKGSATIDPATGQIDYSPNGAFDYLRAGQSATDTFKYTVSDGHGGSSTATVTVTITGVNEPPVANPDTATVGAYSAIWVGAANNDTEINAGDTLSVIALNLTGTKGTATLNPSAPNGFEYSPNGAFDYLSAGETATDTLQYTLSNGNGGTSVGTVTITVTGVNVPPVVQNFSTATLTNQSVALDVLNGATDVNRDDTLTVTSVNTTGTEGAVTIDANGNVTYTPEGADASLAYGESATDTFGYTVSDGHGGTSTGTVTVTITGNPPNVSDLLGNGYLSTQGSQIINAAGQIVRIVSVGWGGTDSSTFAPDDLNLVNYEATMKEMVAAGFNTIRIPWSDALLAASPTAGSINYTLNPDLQGLTSIQVLQKIVSYAGQIGLKVIFDHHNNEGEGGAQPNGLWYDVGGASDGTDGAGQAGTVSQQTFASDWQTFAQLWAGNSTVIGFDLANEPNAGTWAGPSTTSVQTMATSVGDAIQSIDPGALIIVEGPATAQAPEGDLSDVASDPVVLTDPDKVVYSVHEYPQSVDPSTFSGNPAQYIAQMNNAWGYLITNDVAPVWIGEMGSSLATASDQLWAQTLVSYMNGDYAAEGGPSPTGGQQGVSGDWWYWGNFQGAALDGLLAAGDVDIKQDQFAIAQQTYPLQTTATAVTTTVTNSLVLYMAEDYYAGNAQFQVMVDGVAAGGVQTVTAINGEDQVQPFYIDGNFGTGSHTVTVTFLNDAFDTATGQDRNLYVKGISFDGTTQPVSNGAIYTDGSQSFAVNAPGTVTAAVAPDTLILQMANTGTTSGDLFAVYADGSEIGGTETLTAQTIANTVQTFSFSADLGPGPHVIDIEQLNGDGTAPVSGANSIQVDAIDYDGALQSVSQTNPGGTADQDYTIAGPSLLNNGTIDLGSDTASAVVTQSNQMVFMAGGAHAIEIDASGFTLQVAGGSATLSDFNPTADQIDLIGSYATAAQAAAAIVSDGQGGALLPVGAGSLDFLGVAPVSFSAQTFVVR